MSEPELEPDLTLVQRRSALRRRTIIWSALLALLVLFAMGNWVALAVDGGGSWSTWAMAIGGTAVAVATGVFVATFRHATRQLRRRRGPNSDD